MAATKIGETNRKPALVASIIYTQLNDNMCYKIENATSAELHVCVLGLDPGQLSAHLCPAWNQPLGKRSGPSNSPLLLSKGLVLHSFTT